MKTRISLFIASLLFLCLSLDAQEHLTFNRIPMTGNIESFCSKLSHQGFRLVETYSRDGIGYARLNARRGEVRHELIVQTNDKKNVCTVIANHTEYRNWRELVKDYTETRISLDKTYGEAREKVEEFNGDPEDPFSALHANLAQFHTIYVTPKGIISVSIEKTKRYGRVVESFQDSPWPEEFINEIKNR